MTREGNKTVINKAVEQTPFKKINGVTSHAIPEATYENWSETLIHQHATLGTSLNSEYFESSLTHATLIS